MYLRGCDCGNGVGMLDDAPTMLQPMNPAQNVFEPVAPVVDQRQQFDDWMSLISLLSIVWNFAR